MKRNIWLTAVAVAALLCPATPDAGEGPPAREAADLVPDNAIVCIYRPKQHAGSALKMSVQIDGVLIASLGNASYVEVGLEPGRHTFRSNAEKVPDLAIEVTAGEEYYLRMDIYPGAVLAKGLLTWVAPETGYSQFMTGNLHVSRDIQEPSWIVTRDMSIPGSAGTASSPQGSGEPARLYFFAPEDTWVGGWVPKVRGWVSVDGARIDIRSGDYLGVVLDHGPHTVQAGAKAIPFDIFTAAGEDYFISVKPAKSKGEVTWVPRIEGVATIRQQELEYKQSAAQGATQAAEPIPSLGLSATDKPSAGTDDPAKASITVYRPSAGYKWGFKPPLRLNGHELLSVLRKKQCVQLSLDPGAYLLSSTRDDDALPIEIRADEKYYVRMYLGRQKMIGKKGLAGLLLRSPQEGYSEVNWQELEPVSEVAGPYALASTSSCE